MIGAGTNLVEQAAFERVLCGIDDSLASAEAARQAAALAAPDGDVEFIGVVWTTGEGRQRVSSLNPERVQRALNEAVLLATQQGPSARSELVAGRDAAQAMLSRSRGHDLVAVGSHSGQRASGVFFGSVASGLVHRADVPVLVARPAPSGADFPVEIVVATDGSHGAAAAVGLGAAIARARGAHVTLLHVADGDSAEIREELAHEAAELFEAVGRGPAVCDSTGDPHAEISRIAGQLRADLVVVGSRGLGGVKALGSVSERVAHEAPCSVLVARPQG
jgi:nucleotide-binding universal stress UspA family protein